MFKTLLNPKINRGPMGPRGLGPWAHGPQGPGPKQKQRKGITNIDITNKDITKDIRKTPVASPVGTTFLFLRFWTSKHIKIRSSKNIGVFL